MVEPNSFDEIKAWLTAYSESVNTLNYDRAKDLFSDMARYYGIHAHYVQWTDNIAELEWEKVSVRFWKRPLARQRDS